MTAPKNSGFSPGVRDRIDSLFAKAYPELAPLLQQEMRASLPTGDQTEWDPANVPALNPTNPAAARMLIRFFSDASAFYDMDPEAQEKTLSHLKKLASDFGLFAPPLWGMMNENMDVVDHIMDVELGTDADDE